MQNRSIELRLVCVLHAEKASIILCVRVRVTVCVCIFTTPPCMSDVTTWQQNITEHSYLTTRISSVLKDTHGSVEMHTYTHTHTHFHTRNGSIFLSDSEGRDSSEGVGTVGTTANGVREQE